jgi:hypothetical protein
MMDEGARTKILDAAAQHSTAILAWHATTYHGKGINAIEAPIGNVYGLYGFLAEAWKKADIKHKIDAKDRQAAIANGLNDIFGLIPLLPKTFTEAAGKFTTDITNKGIEYIRKLIINEVVQSRPASGSITATHITIENFREMAELLALSMAQKYGLFQRGGDPVTWGKKHIKDPKQKFWDDNGQILPYGTINDSLADELIFDYRKDGGHKAEKPSTTCSSGRKSSIRINSIRWNRP